MPVADMPWGVIPHPINMAAVPRSPSYRFCPPTNPPSYPAPTFKPNVEPYNGRHVEKPLAHPLRQEASWRRCASNRGYKNLGWIRYRTHV